MISFIDESGDHNLNLENLDNQYNVFVLAAVIFRDEDYDKFDRNFRRLKREIFNDDNYIIHTAEITRPSKGNDKRTKQFYNKEFRVNFYNKINDLIEETNFKIASCAIKKGEIVDAYGTYAEDPYILSFENVLNRILFECKYNGKCKIYPEKRTHTENVKLELNFLKLKNSGTRFFRGVEVDRKISEFALNDKKTNMSGLQLADLIVSPIGRHVIGKKPKPKGSEVPYSLVKSKFRYKSFTVFP